MSGFVSPAWMPSSLREAARAGDATAADLESGAAWAHLLAKLQAASATVLVRLRCPATRSTWLRASATSSCCCGSASTTRCAATRARCSRSGRRTPTPCSSGAWTARTASTRVPGLRGGDTYRLSGNRGTARYVGLQTMAGMASTANVLLDEIDLAPNGDFEIDPLGRRAPRELDEDRRRRDAARRAALLLRLGHGGRVVAVDRAAVRSAAVAGVRAGRPAGRDGAPARGVGRLRRGEPRLLPAVRATRATRTRSTRPSTAPRWARRPRTVR